MFKKLTFSLILILLTASCGQKIETSKVELTLISGAQITSFPGGMMVYGRMVSDHTRNFALRLDDPTTSISLANGDWEFFAMGWTGTAPMEGTPKCGDSAASLTGGDATIDLTMTVDSCIPCDTSTGTCNGGSPVHEMSASFATTPFLKPFSLWLMGGMDPTGIGPTNAVNGSFRIILPGANSDPDQPIPNGLVTNCYDIAAGVYSNASLIAPFAPLDEPGFQPFAAAVEVYNMPACTGVKRIHDFKGGLAGKESQGIITYAELTNTADNLLKLTYNPPSPHLVFKDAGVVLGGPNGPIADMGAPDPVGLLSKTFDLVNQSAIDLTGIAISTMSGPFVVSHTCPDPFTAGSTCTITVTGDMASTNQHSTFGISYSDSVPNFFTTYFSVFSKGVDVPATALNWGSGVTTPTNLSQVYPSWTAASLTNGINTQKIYFYNEPTCSATPLDTFNMGSADTYYMTGYGPAGVSMILYYKVESIDLNNNSFFSNCSPGLEFDFVAPNPPNVTFDSPTLGMSPTAIFTAIDCADTPFILINEGGMPTAGDANWQTCTTAAGALAYTVAAEGAYNLEVWAKDPAGNVGPTSTAAIFNYDANFPIDNGANPTFSVGTTAINTAVTVDWVPFTDFSLSDHQIITYTDSACTTGMTVHGMTGTPLNSASITFTAIGTYYVKVSAYDGLGNVTTSACSTSSILVQ